VYPINDHLIDVDFGDVYGSDFNFLAGLAPSSVFLAEGSDIAVKHGKIIKS
jgi:hypothetical protein